MKSELAAKIRLIRGRNVILDSDLAACYGMETFNLNKAVKRNIGRFPVDFMFRLTREEYNFLTFQFGMSKKGRGGRRHLPYVFTDQGVAALSGLLKRERAAEMNVALMRTFAEIRERRASKIVFEVLRELMKPRARARWDSNPERKLRRLQ